ncbi:MAG: hypothetical protein GXX11_01925 [Acholeplasmataceae bacterium]|nr:hypothetical protein [Acholeplasmataceae bacterium]
MGWYFLAICILHPMELEMAQAERLFYTGNINGFLPKHRLKKINYDLEVPKWAKQKAAGATYKQIANAAGVSDNTVYRKLRNIGSLKSKDNHGTFYPYEVKIKEA